MSGVASLADSYGGPKFYQLMGRLVRDELVIAETRLINTEGGTIERTFYLPTESGKNEIRRTRVFYATRHRIHKTLNNE